MKCLHRKQQLLWHPSNDVQGSGFMQRGKVAIRGQYARQMETIRGEALIQTGGFLEDMETREEAQVL